jgi:hypothetical protein
MKKLALLFSLVLCTGMYSQSDQNISNYNFWDTEPSLAVNPANSNNLIAAWMRASGFSIAIATSYSMDGGTTWSTPAYQPHLYPGFRSADPSVVFSSTGAAYLCYIDYEVSHDSGYVMVAHSNDGGASFSPAVQVFSALETPDKPVDRPWIAIDNSGGINNGKLYIVSKSTEDGAFPHHIWMKSSIDNGSTWSAIKLVDDSIPTNLITNAMGVPTVGADGSLYIGYVSYNPPQSPFARMICVKSTDGGASLVPHIIGYGSSSSAITDSLYQGSYVLTANPSDAGNLIYTFTDQRNGDPDILSLSSSDGGLSWSSTPIRVNDDVLSNGIGQDMCWASFSTSGKYSVAWRDRRNGSTASNSAFEIFASVSLNGGLAFSPNQLLSSAPSPFINIQKGNDFIGVAMSDSYVYQDWCDLRTGNTEIFINKKAISQFTSIVENELTIMDAQLFPNPSSGNTTLTFEIKKEQQVEILITDMKGRETGKSISQRLKSGKHEISLQSSALKKGTYMISVKGEKSSSSLKLIMK